ncbi:hypothetical protein IM660_04635 [Ruania alkalisoli]|uniref:Lipoprotein n=1 Tax=Ruania alkalisoli TaxID=2779775 RepID=A0A7M1SXX3_9MICO|nr:hypothetical protein [Ruania alkalisoli]QOR71582.1 hypothetical protein IM660_04635 [Ruania alkalisoli]
MRTTTAHHAPAAALITGLVLSVAACTSPAADSGTDEPAGTETESTEDADAPAADEPAAEDAGDEPTEEAGAGQDAAGAVLGLVTVDDVQYEITELRNCEPLQQEMVERQLELQGLGEHDGERIQIDVYIEEIAGAPYNDVAWSGPEGVFGAPESVDEVTLDAGGTSVRGVATLQDALTQSETVTVDFDLPVPAETIACR